MSECILPAFYRHWEPVARKQHRCCECRAPIRKGEKHFAWTGKWEGRISSGRQHFLCMEACIFIRDAFSGGECIGFGQLFEEFGEMKAGGILNTDLKMATLRSMMAKIKWRKRQEGSGR